jgi:F-type H+-transporting ATPase subunit b
LKDKIVSEAKTAAQVEGGKMLEKAQQEIESQRAAAVAQIKGQVAELSIQIAEKVLRHQLEDKSKQEALVSDLLKEVRLN